MKHGRIGLSAVLLMFGSLLFAQSNEVSGCSLVTSEFRADMV